MKSTITVATTLLTLALHLPAKAQPVSYLCYITLESGHTVDLTGFCGGESERIVRLAEQSGLLLSGVSSQIRREFGQVNRYVTGTITNTTNRQHYLTEVEYQIYNQVSGRLSVSGSGSQYVVTRGSFKPNESANFEIRVPRRLDVVTLSVKSELFSGNKTCFADSVESEAQCRTISRNVQRF